MKLMNGTVLAMCATMFSAGAYAQAGGQMKPMTPMAPMAMDVTYTGCVEQGKTPQAYMLSHAAKDVMMKDAMPKDKMAKDTMMAKDAMMESVTLNLTGTSVDLSKHVGHKVSVTGTPADDKMSKDGMAMSKDAMAMSKDKMDKMPPSFAVASLKMISGSCK